jgi:hypothetical protein
MTRTDAGFDVGKWYSENLDKFPDLVSGWCEYCGDTKMLVEYDDGGLYCYMCGDVEVGKDE